MDDCVDAGHEVEGLVVVGEVGFGEGVLLFVVFGGAAVLGDFVVGAQALGEE